MKLMSATFTLDGQEIPFRPGQSVMQAALSAGVFIPHLCYHPEFRPARQLQAVHRQGQWPPGHLLHHCPPPPGMDVESNTPEILDKRRTLLQMLLVEGNHFCPSCEKSGNCKLQALGYELEVS